MFFFSQNVRTLAVLSLYKITLLTCLGIPQLPYINVDKPTGGSIYYVDISADSSGDGKSLDNAWRTLEDADGEVGPGDIVRVRAGRYPGVLWNESSGAKNNEIVVEPYGDGRVYVEGETRLISNYMIIDGGPNKDIIFRRASSLR